MLTCEFETLIIVIIHSIKLSQFTFFYKAYIKAAIDFDMLSLREFRLRNPKRLDFGWVLGKRRLGGSM